MVTIQPNRVHTESELGNPFSKASNGGLWIEWETNDLI